MRKHKENDSKTESISKPGLLWLARLAGMGTALLPIAFIASCDVAHLHRGYDQAKADYLSQGLPWTPADMEREIGRENNLYWALKPAHDSFLAGKSLQARVFWSDLEKAGRRPYYDPVLDWGQGRGKSYSLDLFARQEISSAAGEAASLAVQNRWSEAMQLLSASSQTAITMRQAPSLTHQMCLTSRHTSYAALNCASQSPGNPQRLIELGEIIRPHCSPPSLREILKGEAMDNLWLYRNLRKLGGWTSLVGRFGNPDRNLTDQLTEGRTFRVAGDIEGVVERSLAAKKMAFWAGLFRRLQTVKAGSLDELNLVSSSAEDATVDRSPSGRLLSSGAEFLKYYCDWVRRDLARARVVRAAVLLQAAKAEGRQLKSVGDLPKADWRDPYDGQPLRVLWENGRVRVWSVGPDGSDNGGIFVPEDKLMTGKNPRGDLVVSLPFLKEAPALW